MTINNQVQCVLFSIPMVLHLVSLYVLHLVRESNLKVNQRLYLLNLSFSEFLICLLGIVKRICKIYGWQLASIYVRYVQAGVATFVYYFVMISLTADRFFEIFCSIKYPLYFTSMCTKVVLAATWILSLCFTAVLCVLNIQNPNMPNDILTYFYFIFGIICVIISISTYGYISKKIYNNRISDDTRNPNFSGDATDATKKKNQLKSRKRLVQSMYLPILLVTSFAIFVVVPEIVYFFYDLTQERMSDGLKTVLTTSYFLAYTSDVVIYVLGSSCIRKIVLRKLGFRKTICDSTPVQSLEIVST